jgi:hypothetical protein
MSDDDLIRRGDAKAMANKHGFLASEDIDEVPAAILRDTEIAPEGGA